MTLIRSCCWWNNVLEGSYGSAVYSFLIGGIFTILVIFDVRPFQFFNLGVPGSLITIGTCIQVVSGIFLEVSACILVLGVYRDVHQLLLPWIIAMLLFTLVLVAGNVNLLLKNMTLNVGSADLLITVISAALCMINAYAELCVISHYQYLSDLKSKASNILPEKKSVSFVRKCSFGGGSVWSNYNPRSCISTPIPLTKIVIPHESIRRKTFDSLPSILIAPNPPPPLQQLPERRTPVIVQTQRQLEAITVLSTNTSILYPSPDPPSSNQSSS